MLVCLFTARKRESKKGKKTSVSTMATKAGGGAFPAEVDKDYTMKKFMSQRDPQFGTGDRATAGQHSFGDIDRMVMELAKEVSEVVDERQPLFAVDDDRRQNAWLEFPVGVDQFQHLLNGDFEFGYFPQSPEPFGSQLDGEVDFDDHVSKAAVGNADKRSEIRVQAEHTIKDQTIDASSAKHNVTGDNEKLAKENVRSGTSADEYAETVTENEEWENRKTRETQSRKLKTVRLMQTEGNCELESHKTELVAQVHKYDDSQAAQRFTPDDAKKKKEAKAGYRAESGAESEGDADASSSEDLYYDRQTPQDDFDDDYDDVRTFGRRLTSSTEIPMSALSDKDTELAALSASSTVSHRDLASPTIPSGFSPGDAVRATTAVREVADASNHADEAELVKVVDKERKTEIIVQLEDKKPEEEIVPREEFTRAKSRNEKRPASGSDASWRSSVSGDDQFSKANDVDNDYVLDEDAVHPLTDYGGGQDDTHWSGSENDDEYDMQRASFEADTNEIDPSTKAEASSDDEDRDPAEGTHYPVTSSSPHADKKPEHEAPEKTEVDDDGEVDKRFRGMVTSREVTKALTEDVAEDDSGSIEDVPITRRTTQRVVNTDSSAKDPEPENANDSDDDDFVSAVIIGTENYLEREYGLPGLTSLDENEEAAEALRGEGPSLCQDEDATGFCALGEDGLPVFGAKCSLGIDDTGDGVEDGNPVIDRLGETVTATTTSVDGEKTESRGRQSISVPIAVGKLSGGEKISKRVDDEASFLAEAASPEDAVNDPSYPTSTAEMLYPKAAMENGNLSGVLENQKGMKEKTKIEAIPAGEIEVVEYAMPGSTNLHGPTRKLDHLLDFV